MDNNLNKSYVGLRDDILKYVEGKSLIVLDVGCATGTNGLYLKSKNIASCVIGIESDKKMAKIAQSNIDRVIDYDLNSGDLSSLFENIQFDYILLGDILEHLIDPWNLLDKLTSFLKDTGKIIISIPNIQHIETLITIYINSTWPTNDRGLFDKTHLRFFTYKDTVKMVNSSGLVVSNMERKFRYRDALHSKFPRFTGKLLRSFFPNLFTFQYILVCEKSRDARQ